MGSQTVLDLIGSTVVFGSLFLITLRVNVNTAESMQIHRDDLLVQQNLVAITSLIEYDLRKIGYCKDFTKLPNPHKAILYATDSSIQFYTDIATPSAPFGDGDLDTITYKISSTGVTGLDNKNVRLLYRFVNSEPEVGVNLGVTQFKFEYFDHDYNLLPTPRELGGLNPTENIFYMRLSIEVQNNTKQTMSEHIAKYDTTYQSAYWRQMRLIARNLKNR